MKLYRSSGLPLSARLAAALVASVAFATALPAQDTGLLVVAHGADSSWNAAVRTTVSGVAWPQGPVATAFLMGPEAGTAGWDAGMRRLLDAGARRVVVVPLMVSSHGAHYRQVQYYAGILAELPPELHGHDHRATPSSPAVPVVVTQALDVAPELAAALVTRWSSLDPADRARAVVLVAHGPESDEEARRWIASLDAVGSLLTTAGLRQDHRVGLLRDDAAPAVRAAAVQALRDTVLALASRTGDSVVALPVMIASSGITRVRIPRDLAGLPVRYANTPLTPHPAISMWIERVAAEASGRLAADSVTRGATSGY